jgi:orotidine-5'-phosphate decarboxylase
MFHDLVRDRTLTLQTRLCLGLDPRAEAYRDVAHLRGHTLSLLEACAPLVACVKPQLAFYEALGMEGLAVLREVSALARTLGVPVLLDAKRGDIGSTAEAYARAWLTVEHRRVRRDGQSLPGLGDADAVRPDGPRTGGAGCSCW